MAYNIAERGFTDAEGRYINHIALSGQPVKLVVIVPFTAPARNKFFLLALIFSLTSKIPHNELCNMLSFGLRLYSQFSYKIIPIHHLYVRFKYFVFYVSVYNLLLGTFEFVLIRSIVCLHNLYFLTWLNSATRIFGC